MKLVVRRFRAELREREDINPGCTVILTDNPQRKNNVLAAELLLKEVFKNRITIERGPHGLLVGSREEAASLRLEAYTENKEEERMMLLSRLLASEIEKYLKHKTGDTIQVFVPDTPEVRLIESLGTRWEDIRYGL